MKKLSYKNTLHACYLGYITQAIIVNLSPIFFVIFKDSYGLDNGDIGIIVFVLFAIQLGVDLASTWFVDKFGFRRCAVIAHLSAAAGLLLLGLLPCVMENKFIGILIAIVIGAVGSGIIEVIISPIVDLLPAESKASAMSLLHSFYCWGQVAVVALSTLLLALIGRDFWYVIPFIWMLIPVTDAVVFNFVPVPDTVPEEEKVSPKKFATSKIFILAAFLMFSSAMAELSMSQWASYFAEKGLGVNKLLGDLMGPCLFGVFMGAGRTLHGIYGGKTDLAKTLSSSSFVCFLGYILTVFSPIPVLSLLGCGITGLGVGLLWPGTLSLTSEKIPGGGTALFALLALFGDLGCSVGPWLTGIISDSVRDTSVFAGLSQTTGMSTEQLALKTGLLIISLFPLMAVFIIRKVGKSKSNDADL